MVTPYLAANWKMHLDRAAIGDFCGALATAAAAVRGVRIGVFPPAVYLERVVAALAGSGVIVGGQTGRPETAGAFTGEVALRMLRDVGAQSVIVGHSERRQLFGESDADVRARLVAALELGLDAILCVGETLAERQAGATRAVVERQARAALTGLDGDTVARRVTLAYEPVWAIGTGHVATPEQARQAHAELRELLAALFGSRTAAATTLQYGGSVKPDNIAELLDCPDVNGALVGGASLDPNSFRALLGACATQASGARTN